MFYAFHVSITEKDDDDDGVSYAGECSSFFDAKQKMYIDLWNCRLSGDIHGTMYFFDDELPVPAVPLGVEITDADLCDDLQNDEPMEVVGCKKAGMRWMELAVDGEKVPPAIIMSTRKERVLLRQMLRTLPVITPDADGIVRPAQVVAADNGLVGEKEAFKFIDVSKKADAEETVERAK